MHDLLRERVMRGLENLPEERIYQVLDYIEFLGSKYARDGARAPVSPLRRFGERLEDQMRLQGVGMGAIRGTLGILGTADRVINDVADAGKTFLKDVESGLRTPPGRETPRIPGADTRSGGPPSPNPSRPGSEGEGSGPPSSTPE